MNHSELNGATIFTSRRLHCRRWLPDDIDRLFEIYSDPEGARWVGDGQPITRSECDDWLAVTHQNYRQRGYGMFALEDVTTGNVIGFCGLVHPGGQTEAEIKYSFQRQRWGQGLASEVVPQLLMWGHQAMGLNRVIATVAPENLASQRVLEKSGMRLLKKSEDEQGLPMLVFEWLAG